MESKCPNCNTPITMGVPKCPNCGVAFKWPQEVLDNLNQQTMVSQSAQQQASHPVEQAQQPTPHSDKTLQNKIKFKNQPTWIAKYSGIFVFISFFVIPLGWVLAIKYWKVKEPPIHNAVKSILLSSMIIPVIILVLVLVGVVYRLVH
jgi:hypothetical protein